MSKPLNIGVRTWWGKLTEEQRGTFAAFFPEDGSASYAAVTQIAFAKSLLGKKLRTYEDTALRHYKREAAP